MKNKWANMFLNPFEDFSERDLFIVGVIGFIGTVLLSYFGRVVFDGIIQIHIAPTKFSTILLGNLSNVTILVIGMLVMAKIVYRKTRFIEILNNVLISRIPIFLTGILVCGLGKVIPVGRIAEEGFAFGKVLQSSDMVNIALLSIFCLFFIVYFFYLLVVGIRHSMNSKKLGHGFLIVVLVFILDAIALLIYRSLFI